MLIFSIGIIVWLLGARYTYKLGNFLEKQEYENLGVSYTPSASLDETNRTFCFWLWPLLILLLSIEYVSKVTKGKLSNIIFGSKPK